MSITNMMEAISVINRNCGKLIKDKDDETSSKKDNEVVDNNVSKHKLEIMDAYKNIFIDTSAIASKLDTIVSELSNPHYVHCMDKDDVIEILKSIHQHLTNIQINEMEQFDIVKKYLLD